DWRRPSACPTSRLRVSCGRCPSSISSDRRRRGMAELPSGTVTFLYTDIEGSTRLWEEHPTAMRKAVTRHDAILRDTIGAQGGHVLASQATTDLTRDVLPVGTSLRDLGEHGLRDLVRPEHVFQLSHLDLPLDFPPIKTLDAFSHNLPLQLTSFVGRARELAEV